MFFENFVLDMQLSATFRSSHTGRQGRLHIVVPHAAESPAYQRSCNQTLTGKFSVLHIKLGQALQYRRTERLICKVTQQQTVRGVVYGWKCKLINTVGLVGVSIPNEPRRQNYAEKRMSNVVGGDVGDL